MRGVQWIDWVQVPGRFLVLARRLLEVAQPCDSPLRHCPGLPSKIVCILLVTLLHKFVPFSSAPLSNNLNPQIKSPTTSLLRLLFTTSSLFNSSPMDFIKDQISGSGSKQEGEQKQHEKKEDQGFMDQMYNKANTAAGGGKASEKNEDLLDKGE